MELQNDNFKKGLRDGIPICLGYLSVSFAFGISAVNMGLSVLEAVLISMFNLTSAGQLAGAPIIAAFGSLWELAATQVVINLRYSLMSVSLSQKLGKNVRFFDRLWIAFCNTDEIFAVASGNKGAVGKRYMLGLSLTPYFGWALGTLLGAVAGDILPEIVASSLGVALYCMFIAIVVPPCKKSRPTLMCVLLAVALSCVFNYVPALKAIGDGFIIIICAVAASLLFALVAPVKDGMRTDLEVEQNA
ncbi:MAG: AzlC family ABC transporter permease [Clostridia bacterium]|nr:AzlC family ABC transporter permease [Clostridia bacterium]